MADSAGTSAAICGVWVDDDDGAGCAISQYIWSRSNQKQEVTRADLKTSFLQDDKKYDKYFVLISITSMENHNFLLFITRVLYHLHYLKLVSKLVLVVVDENFDEKKHMINYLDIFDKVHAVPGPAGTIEEQDLKVINSKLSEKEIKDFLPIGNVGIGLAWNYFYGYLNLISPGITGRIDLSEHYLRNGKRMSRKFFIIIPESGKTPERFSDIDQRFITEGPLDEGVKKIRAGKERLYNSYVHRITGKNQEDVVYFCGEFATPVLVLRKMLDKKEIDQAEFERQMRLFRLTLKAIVNHAKNPDGSKGRTEIVTFADQDRTFSLADQLHKEISSSTDDSKMEFESEVSDGACAHISGSHQSDEQMPPEPVLRMIYGQDEAGKRWAIEFAYLFERVEANVYSRRVINTFEDLRPRIVDPTVVDKHFHEEDVDNDKLIIILSEDFKDEVEKHAGALIANPIWFPRTTFIVDLRDVPPWLDHSGADYINARKDDIKERIFCSVFGGVQDQAARLPVGNVAEGLAWSYHHNYLALLGPTIADRIKTTEYFSRGMMPSKLFILLPWSCSCPPTLTKADQNITSAGNLETLKIQIAGNDRSYNNAIYKISSPPHTYYACVEYCTPVLVMYEMAAEGKAGLSPEQKEAQLFVFRQILQKNYQQV